MFPLSAAIPANDQDELRNKASLTLKSLTAIFYTGGRECISKKRPHYLEAAQGTEKLLSQVVPVYLQY